MHGDRDGSARSPVDPIAIIAPRRRASVRPYDVGAMQIATIVCRREVARARVLATSIAEHAPNASVLALVLDATSDEQASPEPFTLLRPGDVPIEGIGALAAMLTTAELREACKPLLLRHMLASAPGEAAVYLDPETLVCGPLDDLDRLAAEHGVLVRARTRGVLPADGRRPNEADLRGWGLHDGGLIVLGDGDHRELLAWWARAGRAGGTAEGAAPPMDRVATIGAGACEIVDPGLGTSFWDLPGREVVAHEKSVLIDGSPLRLMRLAGFDVHEPLALSDAQNRLRVADVPPLAALCERYAQLLLDAGEEMASSIPYVFDRLPDGTRLDHRLRMICRRAVDEGALRHSPFTRWGLDELYGWLGQPASTGASHGINRLCVLVRELQPELRAAYGNLDHDHEAHGLVLWLHEHGVREGTLPAAVVPPTSAHELEAERRRRASKLNFGVNVAGYFTAEIGVGEAGRLLVDALDAAEVPLLPVLPPTPPPSRRMHPYTALQAGAAAFPINVICVNADGLLRFREDVGLPFFENRHNIGVWWWEVDVMPSEWHAAFELLDEVWVGTEHVARAITPASPVPVHTVRFPILAPGVEPLSRAALGLEDEWVFLSMFDHGSVLDRKNPLGTIAAFAEAFAPESGAALVLKSTNAEHDPVGRERLRVAAARHPHVHLVEGYLSPEQTHALIATADCFVSLHRAEGLGLGPAEAMARGKPVIATGYSGNMDYMTEANAYLVGYSLRAVGPGCWPYPEEAHWAEVDLDHAARLMREVFDDQAAANERGARAAADVRRTHSLEAAGGSMRARLENVAARLRDVPYLPLPEFEVNLTHGARGRVLRRLFPGVLAALERELAQLWSANEQRQFDLRAAERGTLVSTQAATLAALRRVEQLGGEQARDAELGARTARLDWDSD
jgi:glycosyltransferase involved in cell wall biosynthesis